MELYGRHNEAVSHEAGQPFEIKRRWLFSSVGDIFILRQNRVLLGVNVLDFDRNEVVFIDAVSSLC